MWKLTWLSLLQETKSLALSSSEEKSSEFDWLERKLTRKQKYEGKTKQVLCKIYIFLPSDYMIIYLQEQAPESFFMSRKLQTYIRGYSPFILA